MKKYFKRVFISTAMLFLLLAFIAPAISASTFASQDLTSYLDPNNLDLVQKVYKPPIESKPYPEDSSIPETQESPQDSSTPETQEGPQDSSTPETQESPQTNTTVDIIADEPQEKEEPAIPEPIEPDLDYTNGKSNSRGKGIFHKSAKKSK